MTAPSIPTCRRSCAKNWLEQYELAEPDPKFDFKAYVAKAESDAVLAQRAGVRMLVGTDLGVQSLIPGRSVHDEMAEMVRLLSMTPAEALRTATTNAASAAGMAESAGGIARGYRADFVLLDANPLTDISRTRSIAGVLQGGKWLDRRALETLRASTRRTMKQGGTCLAAA